MILRMEGCSAITEVDIYLNLQGSLSAEQMNFGQEEVGYANILDLEVLVAEYLEYSKHGETGRIENEQAMHVMQMLETFERCVRLLTDGVFDD